MPGRRTACRAGVGGDIAASDEHLQQLADGAERGRRGDAGLDSHPLQQPAQRRGHLRAAQADQRVGARAPPDRSRRTVRRWRRARRRSVGSWSASRFSCRFGGGRAQATSTGSDRAVPIGSTLRRRPVAMAPAAPATIEHAGRQRQLPGHRSGRQPSGGDRVGELEVVEVCPDRGRPVHRSGRGWRGAAGGRRRRSGGRLPALRRADRA